MSKSMQSIEPNMKRWVFLLLFVNWLMASTWCPICGNDLKIHQATAHKAKLHNGTERHYCSLRCLVVDSQEYGIQDIRVRDYHNKTFIDANGSLYVVGSSLQGVHSKLSKVAFANPKDAQTFAGQKGGAIKSFEEARKIALDLLKSDNAYDDKIKTAKIYPMGKKIYTQKCKSFAIELNDFLEIDELKSHIETQKLCPRLNAQQFQALALYLWEQQRHNVLEAIEDRVVVGEDEKCPVCGMFTYKYPRWAAQIFFVHDNCEHHLSFDGVKDLMKFYFDPNKWGNYHRIHAKTITKILVTNYYTQKAIDAKSAFYVIGSDTYGPMGHELIPFGSFEEALGFKNDHRGAKIVRFDEITPTMVYALDK